MFNMMLARLWAGELLASPAPDAVADAPFSVFEFVLLIRFQLSWRRETHSEWSGVLKE